MIGLDTNVLLRYLAQDDPVQSPRATVIVTRRLTEQEPGFVSLVTILEVVWVLKSLYKRSRQEIANDIEMVLAADTLEVQNEQEVYHALVALRNGTGTGNCRRFRKRFACAVTPRPTRWSRPAA